MSTLALIWMLASTSVSADESRIFGRSSAPPIVIRADNPPIPRCTDSAEMAILPLWTEVRADFEAQRFDALEARLQLLRTSHSCTDRPLTLALDALRDGAPGLTPLFDAWVQAWPRSADARAARGSHFVERAMTTRGASLAASTSRQKFAAMEMVLARAFSDFDAAIEMDPRHGHARGERLLATRLSGKSGELRAEFLAARMAAPSSFALYSAAVEAFEPRWGGTIEDVMQVANYALERRADNPDLGSLPSYAKCTIANTAIQNGEPERALELVDLVLAAGHADPICYSVQGSAYRKLDRYAQHVLVHEYLRKSGGSVGASAVRAADSLRMLKRYGEALALFDDSLRFRSGNVDALCGRADVLRALRRWEEGMRSVESALALAPDDQYCRNVKSRLEKRAFDSTPG